MSKFSERRTDRLRSSRKRLIAGGFVRAGAWRMVAGAIQFEGKVALSREPGVYAYVVGSDVRYVGSAQRGLHGRLRHYEIAKTLRTVHRVRKKIVRLLKAKQKVEVFTIVPKRLYWSGLPVNMVAGLEEGLIRELRPIWNRRGRGGALRDLE